MLTATYPYAADISYFIWKSIVCEKLNGRYVALSRLFADCSFVILLFQFTKKYCSWHNTLEAAL